MRLLLDTHILIALVDRRLSALTQPMPDGMSDPNSYLFVSVASLWEIAIKARLGKLNIGFRPRDLPSAVEQARIEVLIVNHHHVLAELDPEPPTRDPFDRLLLAQCQVEGLKLVTLDRALIGHPLAWRAP